MVRKDTLWGWLAVVSLVCLPLGGAAADVDRDGGEAKESEDPEKKLEPELEGMREGESHEEYHRRLAEEGEKTLAEIQRLLDEIQNNLSRKDTGPQTQARQKQVVKRLEELIEKVGKQCSQCQQGGQGKQSSSSAGARNRPQPQNARQRSAQETEAERRERERQAKELEERRRLEEKKKEQDSPGKVPNTRVAEDRPPDNKGGRLLDRLRKSARWGLLPSKVREAMLSTGGKDAPAEYREVIERYYKRLSEFYERKR